MVTPDGVATLRRSIKVKMKYNLFYRELVVGTIQREEVEWPWVHGKIELREGFLNDESELAEKIKKFRELTIEEERLSEESEYTDNSEELNAIYEREEKEFGDLIESNEWYLIEETKKEKIEICCPSFARDNYVSWR